MHDTDVKAKKLAIDKAKWKMNCSANAASTISSLHQETIDFSTILSELSESFEKIKDNNLLEVEAMLLSQAHTLNIFFHRCLSQVGSSEFIPHIQMMSDLALRAQNNCRKTLLTLAEVKNPKRATFIKQQNNAIGNQQINNSGKIKNSANELLEIKDEQPRLDTRTTIETITANPQMETLEISRCKN